ncbi:MAG: TatD family hydrolase [Fermentimonas sp.]|nr:TatD family hydrolase [Fermentimonas sp.]MDD3189151.1 TatD family hydrolase [Fermentimonas sp.]MDD3512373.1 TatD family hydrolase [Fermentimonas sp.]MDD4284682.1 TatD family hydrolase [Fermentimonas sp.]MDD4724615.1 TatD family hydrolase [Fermentimonas sp.]
MGIIDTHAHLFVADYENDIDTVIYRAKKVGVEKVLLPNIDESTIESLNKCLSKDPAFFIPMMGLHPTSVKEDWKRQIEPIYNELTKSKYYAIGEIGIDLYWDTSLKSEQTDVFEEELKWSLDMNLPLSIHFRSATKEVINSIRRVGENSLRGVFHSFGGNRDELNAILELNNFMIGVNGVVTFKNSGLAETLMYCPLDRVVIETDSPYLAPVPHRGKRNESSYICEIVRKLSEIWQKSETEVEKITTINAKRLFGLKT